MTRPIMMIVANIGLYLFFAFVAWDFWWISRLPAADPLTRYYFGLFAIVFNVAAFGLHSWMRK